MHAGPEAAVGVLLALYGRPALGRGQHVDVSIRETQLSTLISGAGQAVSSGSRSARSGHRTGRTREIWRCRDGFVSYGLRGGPARAGSLAATVEYMAESGLAPDWLRAVDWSSYSPLTLTDEELERRLAGFKHFSGVPDRHYRRARAQGSSAVARAVKCYPFGGESLLGDCNLVSICIEDLKKDNLFTISLKDGKFAIENGKPKEPHLTITLSKELFQKTVLGRYRWLWTMGMDEVQISSDPGKTLVRMWKELGKAS